MGIYFDIPSAVFYPLRGDYAFEEFTVLSKAITEVEIPCKDLAEAS